MYENERIYHNYGPGNRELKKSKISRGYIEVDILGETLLFTRTKSDKTPM